MANVNARPIVSNQSAQFPNDRTQLPQFIVIRLEPDGPIIRFKGRQSWTLQNLILAGEKGCTAITHPGPRWSAYIHELRKAGLLIETHHEPHGGTGIG